MGSQIYQWNHDTEEAQHVDDKKRVFDIWKGGSSDCRRESR